MVIPSEEESHGHIGVVIAKEPAHYNAWDNLPTRVRFEDGMLDDWGFTFKLGGS